MKYPIKKTASRHEGHACLFLISHIAFTPVKILKSLDFKKKRKSSTGVFCKSLVSTAHVNLLFPKNAVCIRHAAFSELLPKMHIYPPTHTLV